MNNLLATFNILQCIAWNNPDGYTVDARFFQPIKNGYAVAVKDTQNSFGPYGLAKVIAYAKHHPEITAFGGWLNTENNKYYFDAVIICQDLNEAVKLGKLNKQIAIFNLSTLEEIKL